jgi:hypothetical protein
MIFFWLYDKLPERNTNGMKRVIFCTCLFSSVNLSVIILFYYRQTKTYRRMIYQRSIFIYNFIDKLIANRMMIQIPTENCVGKYKNSGSEK